MRVEPAGLNKRDALALAGRWYAWFTAQHENEPGDDDFGWSLLAEQLGDMDLQVSGALDERDVDGAGYVRSPKTEARVRTFLAGHGRVDAFLLEAGVHLSSTGLGSFYDALERQFFAAMRLLARRSNDDYSPDDHRASLPEWRDVKPVTQGVTLTDLFDRWAAETKPREKTVYSWRRVIGQLVEHLGHNDAAKVTKAEVVAWKDAMVAAGLAMKTVRDSKLAPVLAILRWSATNNLIQSNPAEGVGGTVRSAGGKRRGFSDEVAQQVFGAAQRERTPHLR